MSLRPDELPQHPHVIERIEELKEHEDPKHVKLPDQMDAIIRAIGHVMCWSNGLLIGIIILQVTLRYGFNGGYIMLEELQWHLYAIGVMFGVSYAQINDSHIRVDIFHMRFSDRTKRIVEIFGILVFVLPFVWVIFHHSLAFVADAWRTGETSDAPLGLPYRWAIKSVIPISFAMLGFSAISRLIRDTYILIKGE